jgi:hypothetical protein
LKSESFIYQKIREIFNKHSSNGTPRKMIEANMAREFRLGKMEIKRVMDEMHLENDIQRKHIKKVRLEAPTITQDTYLADLRVH